MAPKAKVTYVNWKRALLKLNEKLLETGDLFLPSQTQFKFKPRHRFKIESTNEFFALTSRKRRQACSNLISFIAFAIALQVNRRERKKI